MKKEIKRIRKIAILEHFLKLKCERRTFSIWFKWFVYDIDCYIFDNRIIAIDRSCKTSLSVSDDKNFHTPTELIELLMIGK